MAARKRKNLRDKFPEKLIGVHKHCKVASRNRYKFLLWGLNGFEIFGCPFPQHGLFTEQPSNCCRCRARG